MSGSGPQHTTMPLSIHGKPSSSRSESLAIAWLFPRPADSEVLLNLDSDDEHIVGRDDECSVKLAGPDISRRHARLHCEGSDIVVTDLGSRNGTFVNGSRIKSASIGLHDVVRFGAHVALVTDQIGLTEEIGPGLLAGPLMLARLSPLMRAASSDLPVILEGETGTGKEVVARWLHNLSGRSGTFSAINCAALPESLAESELFGHCRGAFTGATRDSAGVFRGAEGGTLLLDEVSDLPLTIQAKLLRVLEQREVHPLGAAKPVAIDVRIVVATQESLTNTVNQKRFRQDLLARLNGITVKLPPLRNRRQDVLPLLSHVLAKLTSGRAPTFNADFVERLCAYDWPFNVREVVLLARRLSALHGADTCLRADQLPAYFSGTGAKSQKEPGGSPTAPLRISAEPIEFPALIAALRASQGNIAQASAMLGISRQRAYRLMQGHSVDLDALRKQTGAQP